MGPVLGLTFFAVVICLFAFGLIGLDRFLQNREEKSQSPEQKSKWIDDFLLEFHEYARNQREEERRRQEEERRRLEQIRKQKEEERKKMTDAHKSADARCMLNGIRDAVMSARRNGNDDYYYSYRQTTYNQILNHIAVHTVRHGVSVDDLSDEQLRILASQVMATR